MAEDKNTVDFLNNLDTEVFTEEPTEVEEKEVQEEDKILPFHQDPKVQRYLKKEIDKALKDRPSAEQQFRQEVSEDINLPDSFVRLVGNDTDEKKQVLKDLSKYFGTLKGDAKKEAWEEMQAQARAAEAASAEADRAAVEELESSFEEIEDIYNVDLSSNSASAKKQRAEFIEYIRKISPKNKESGEVIGFPDLIGAFEDFQERSKRAPATRAKELASRSLTRSTDASTAIPTGRSWKDVDKHFAKLKAN